MSRPDLGYIAELQDDATRLIKVGRTRSVKQRIATIRQTSPFDVRLVAIFSKGAEGERELKEAMLEHRQKGEWFRPNDILDLTLRRWRKEGRLMKQVEVGAAYIEQYIIPVVRAYLGDREPLSNTGGDLVYRLLHGGLPDVRARTSELWAATKGAVTWEMITGYVPLGEDDLPVAIRPLAESARAA